MAYLPMVEIPTEPIWGMVAGLILVMVVVLILPLKIKWIEHNLEIFFLIMGTLAVTISQQWSGSLIIEALKAPVTISGIPIGIFEVVLIFGLLIYFLNKPFYRVIGNMVNKIGIRIFLFILLLILSLISSLISVIVTSVILAEIVAALPLNRRERIKLVVVACFGVGLGAVLTPLGEPMSTILVQRLSGPPYNAGFTWPIGHFAIFVVPAIAALAIFGAAWIGRRVSVKSAPIPETRMDGASAKLDPPQDAPTIAYSETLGTVILRAVKVFAFVAALVLLGEGLKPLVVWFFMKISASALFWINMISAILDNATLTAIEISPDMSLSQIICIAMGLLIAGGMLIPGNIPNIVAAGRLKISMKEWAVLGLPIGIVIMAIFFVVLILTGHT